MKISFSKSMAAALAVCVGTFSGISALAAEPTVYTTTTYDYAEKGNSATVTVTSNVTGGDAGAQVTYLVSSGSDSTLAIKYIDQAELDSDGAATFTFSADQDAIYDGVVSARYGSDQSYTGLPSFTFNDGVNYLSQGTATCTVTANAVATSDDLTTYADAGIKDGDYVIVGTVSGNYTKYGVTMTDGTTTYDFQAYGSIGGTDNGVFVIIVSGLSSSDVDGCTVIGYAE